MEKTKETQMVKEIPLSQIVPSKLNPRKSFDDAKIKELAASIKEKGVIQAIVVRETTARTIPAAITYEIVCGERRYRASKIAGRDTIPAVVKDLTDEQALEFQVIENLQREDLGAIEEARGFKTMIDRCKYTAADLAGRIDRSQAYIAARLKLLTLPAKVQDAITADQISPAHGLVIARVQDPKEQLQLLQAIVRQKLSARAAENALDRCGARLDEAPFNTSQCGACEHNGAKQKDLFDKDTNLKGRCLNAECFNRKVGERLTEAKKILADKGIKVVTDKDLEKRSIYNTQRLDDENKKKLGKKYNDKCAHCKDRVFVEAKNGYYQDSPRTITERCLNTRCFQSTFREPPQKRTPKEIQAEAREKAKQAADKAKAAAIAKAVLSSDKMPLVRLAILADGMVSGNAKDETIKMLGLKEDYPGTDDIVKVDRKKIEAFLAQSVVDEIERWANDEYTSRNYLLPLAKSIGIDVKKIKVPKEIAK